MAMGDPESDAEDSRLLIHEESVNSGLTESQNRLTEGSTYEEAISQAGYGCFHYGLLCLCGWALSSDAIEVLSISFVLPAATCDLQLTASDKGWLTAIIFAGMMIGGYMWGTLADLNGRRYILLYSLTVNGLGGLGSSFAPNFISFIILRFISGVGVGGSLPVIFSYFTEFQPKEKRGSMIVMLATFWMSGNIIAAGLAWIIIPFGHLGDFSESYPYNSWRLFLAVCTIPAISSGFGFACMPESPKYLMQMGLEDSALQVFRKMHRRNFKQRGGFDITQLECSERKKREEEYVSERCCGDTWHTFKLSIKQFCESTVQLFKPPLTRTSIVMVIIFFTLSFGYYGMYMWFPELFARMDLYGGSPCNLGTPSNTTNTTKNGTGCDSSVSSTVYFESFLTAASNLPGNIFAILLIDRIGRKILLAGSMVVSAVSVFFIAMLNNSTQSLVFSCVFGGISTIGWDALDVIGMELYPTDLRSTANGVMMGVGRLASIAGNLVFGLLVDVYCLVPMFMVSGLMAFGGLATLLLPSTVNIDLT